MTIAWHLDPATNRQALETAGIVRIAAPLDEGDAAALRHELLHDLTWAMAARAGKNEWEVAADEREAIGQQRIAAIVASTARNHFAFVYDVCRISQDPAERAARGLMIDRALDALNAAATRAALSDLVGEPVGAVSGNATRFRPGHFLAVHDDEIAGKRRIAAWVLSLNPGWRSDWGGMLQFTDARGDVIRGLCPGGNELHVFSVPQPHAVTLVAPFAGEPRLALSGWFER